MSRNIVVAFLASSRHDTEIDRAISEFTNKGYSAEIIDLSERSMSIVSLPGVLEAVRVQYGPGNESRIVILSDIPHLILAWYRCFNSIADDFVYVIPQAPLTRVPVVENAPFFVHLWGFRGVQHETLEGKIYVNLNPSNCLGIISLLLTNNHFRYFEDLDKFPFDSVPPRKMSRNKGYLLGESRYPFDIRAEWGWEDINLDQRETTPTVSDLRSLISDHRYFSPYLLVAICHYSGLENVTKWKVIVNLAEHYGTYNVAEQELVFSLLLEVISKNDLPFFDAVKFYRLLVAHGVRSKELLRTFIRRIIADVKHMETHHDLLWDLLILVNRLNVALYPQYYADRKILLQRYCLNYQDKVERSADTRVAPPGNCVVFVTGELLKLQHSPTLVTLEIAKSLAKHTDRRVIIIVEEGFRGNAKYEAEMSSVAPSTTSGKRSKGYAELHQEYLSHSPHVEIIYVEPTDSKEESVIHCVNDVLRLNPKLIFTSDELSVTCELLYPYYPIVYVSYGTVIPAVTADVYLFQDHDEAKRQNSDYGTIAPERLGHFSGAITLPTPKKTIHRSDYWLHNKDFVLVTVGNRLDEEVESTFADTIVSFLTAHRSARWLIVGPGKIRSIEEKYVHHLGHQILRVQYEEDLPALYEICDVYVNPVRRGGGTSVVMAMKAGLPVVISSIPSDGLVYVGKENGVGVEPGSFVTELEKLYRDVQYRSRKGRLMQQRLESFTEEKFLCQMEFYSSMAEKSFSLRNSAES